MQCPETEAGIHEQSDHPYEQFLVGQKQRRHDWKSVRESKRTKVAETPAPTTVTSINASSSLQDDVVTVLRQQLAAKTEECGQLLKRLDAMEEASTKILSCQIQMQENFVKVMDIRGSSDLEQQGKFDCFVFEMLWIKNLKPNLNLKTDSIRATSYNIFDNDVQLTSKCRRFLEVFNLEMFLKNILIAVSYS